ncbi:hypothetical protein MCOR27_007930 [Pyricularia oryzae]|uniref:NACHT domain-containing protein n=1 Tax=Pyricularia grisea TaxID=148305 RepID=A0ABQ8NZ54_PYRGI|nr:hypothetical protein MCOR01_001425 [Pyricularia oryzae]KAI6304242.1 hypothetical protein MCOR33_000757 [Pyricularia grisea]KAI6257010.1 hypothetical protein MCOR19_006520 [Pyricularia oryzae]KAI6273334.1 hypothetical protein MCOR27_007930 [Pyricularia oryzae]KAI6308607.1 hypothetical protein MCOR29_009250 [Pyricularia oryzae]
MPSNSEYTIGWIAAIETEFVAASRFLDKRHGRPESQDAADSNSYKLGSMEGHNVVIACLPQGEYGLASAAVVATNMLRSFPNVRIGLMVGIAGGAPRDGHDIRLGDVVVSASSGGKGAVFQYDYGKTIQKKPFTCTQLLNQPPAVLRTAVASLSAQHREDGHDFGSQIDRLLDNSRLEDFRRPPHTSDKLYKPDVVHLNSCSEVCGGDPEHLVARGPRDKKKDDPTIHYGTIASANQLMKDAKARDRLAAKHDVLCFEMEAAGLMNNFPCLVIRGICDYSDSHKNKEWQGFAAMMAAAYAKALLGVLVPERIGKEKTIGEAIGLVEKAMNSVENKVTLLQSNTHIDKLKGWLSPADPSTNANRAKELRHKGTGAWLLENRKFKEWRDGPRRHLWLRALVGCGKTVLCAAVLEQLAKLDDCLVLNFFFDFADTEKQTYDSMLRVLLFQLYLDSPDPESRGYLDKLFQSNRNGQAQPSGHDLWECLKSMLAIQKKVYVVLDALDESETRGDLATWINNVVHEPGLQQLHLIFTSRPESDFDCIPSMIGMDNCIELDKDAVNADIRAYVLSRLQNDRDFKSKNLPADLVEDICNRIGSGADGMFRWAFCQLQTLSAGTNLFDIRSALDDLPSNLEETYKLMLDKIPKDSRKAAISLLTFLAYCERPLKLLEVKDIMATAEAEPEPFDVERRTFDEAILRHCPGMIARISPEEKPYRERVDEFQLAHFSIKEFLLGQPNFTVPTASIRITTTCLSYLVDVGDHHTIHEVRVLFPLAELAAKLWPTHAYQAQASEEMPKITTAVLKLFKNKAAFQIWGQLYQPDRPDNIRPGPPEGSQLYYTSFIGLKQAVIQLLAEGADVDAQGGWYCSALQAASSQRHIDIVDLLLENGADINIYGGYGDVSALQFALLQNHMDMFEFMLKRGADIDAYGGHRFGNALQIASMSNDIDMVRFLLGKGADVNAQGGKYGNALQAASCKGYMEIVELLLEKGAEVNAQGSEFGNALQAASYEGYMEIVKLLLEKGADVNAKGGYFGHALQAASYKGYMEIVELLLEKGADVNAQGGKFGNALQAASYGGYMEIVKLLLEKGADVNAKGGEYGSALEAASEAGYTKTVALLLEKGARR